MSIEKTMRAATLSLLFAGLAVAAVNAVGLTDSESATRALEAQGLQPVKVGGLAPLSCASGDLYRTKFTAKNPAGKEVSGVVCKGVFKGSTIRFE